MHTPLVSGLIADELYVNSFDDTKGTGGRVGSSPYLNDNSGNAVNVWKEGSLNIGFAYFHFENTSLSLEDINFVSMELEIPIIEDAGIWLNIRYNPTEYPSFEQEWLAMDNYPSAPFWISRNLTALFPDVVNSTERINTMRIEVYCNNGTELKYMQIRRAFMQINEPFHVVNINVRIEDQPPLYNYDAVRINGGAYRDNEIVEFYNGTYDLTAYLTRFSFNNWTATANIYIHNNTAQTTIIEIFGDSTLTLNLDNKPDLTNLYTWIVLLLAALFLIVWSPSWFAWGIKKKGVTVETIERLGYAMLLFLVGFGLLVMWLYA